MPTTPSCDTQRGRKFQGEGKEAEKGGGSSAAASRCSHITSSSSSLHFIVPPLGID
jgi:hypothetical protein